MKSHIGALCALLVLFAGAASAQEDHDDWIDVQSISAAQTRVGAATRLADGKYKTPRGQFLVVASGKVVATGPDYRSYQPARAGSGPARAAPGAVAADGQQQPMGLLLPAVQKVQAPPGGNSAAPAAAGGFQPAPQKGIEPDEIDHANRATNPPRATLPLRAGAGRASVQQMMLRLKPRQPVPVPPGGGMSHPTAVQTQPAEPPKYEIAECGTAASPMICCHHEAGDGSSCNLFKILCENAGGTAQGDGESAACSDW